MSRGIGAIEVIRGVLPEELVPLFVVITHLGSTSFYVGVLSVLYWIDHSKILAREKVAFVIPMAVIGGGCVVLLKGIFELPRPPEEMWLIETDGYGFPSGHALASTVVWGSLALVWSEGRNKNDKWRNTISRKGVKAGLFSSIAVILISFSRVLLGVHYTVDVVAGVMIGAGVLILGYWIGIRRKRVAGKDGYGVEKLFVVSILVGIGATVVTGADFYSVFFTGIGVGGFLIAKLTEVFKITTRSVKEKVALIGAGLPFVGTTFYLASEVQLAPVVFILGVLLVSGGLYLPAIPRKLRRTQAKAPSFR
ncbi:MAG: phosphatase PAP2 family protein [Halobacteria archaeon]|nr:phosphatase PAP2 family protein [Halobacteria archaeon]